jgi:RNA polymerase sigma-70 factor (ECF subfamily)
MEAVKRTPADRSEQNDLYTEVATRYGPALQRLARAYEANPDKRRDLLQEIHIALWRSFATFDDRCSVRTWVYRVAHNTATSQVIRRRGSTPTFVGLDEIDAASDDQDQEQAFDRQRALERLTALIHRLKPVDRQVMLLYLEGLDAASIEDVTGISKANVATKVHRIKKLLTERFHHGLHDVE